MKGFIRRKSIRIQKPNFQTIRKEWSWDNIRSYFCYRPKLWLGLPIAAVVSFVVVFLVSMFSGFEVNPLHYGLTVALTSSVGYTIGVITLAANAKEQAEEEEQEELKSPIYKAITYLIFAASCLLFVAGMVYEFLHDESQLLDTISAAVTIASSFVPVAFGRLIDK